MTGAAVDAAAAQPVENFYRGKTVTMVIGYPPAGANDVYARMAARHIGKHIPGNPNVVPRNMPGAGSLIAANHIFNVAPKDGTVLGLLVPTLPLEEALGASAVKFKSAAFHWVGRMARAPNITFIMATAPVKAIADAFDKTAILGATGRSATNAIYPTVLNNVLGTKFKVVTGYEGSAAAMLAMERGEVEGHSATYDTLKTVHPDWLAQKKVNVVVQYSLARHPELKDVPTTVELARNAEQAQNPARGVERIRNRQVRADDAGDASRPRAGAAAGVRRHGEGPGVHRRCAKAPCRARPDAGDGAAEDRGRGRGHAARHRRQGEGDLSAQLTRWPVALTSV